MMEMDNSSNFFGGDRLFTAFLCMIFDIFLAF